VLARVSIKPCEKILHRLRSVAAQASRQSRSLARASCQVIAGENQRVQEMLVSCGFLHRSRNHSIAAKYSSEKHFCTMICDASDRATLRARASSLTLR
jgi:hypothetical protein